MILDKMLVGLGSLFGIIFTFWFFLLKKDDIITVSDRVDIVVDGGYKPDIISIPRGKKITINFLRRDPNPCLEEVILSEFKVKKYLPLDKKVSIDIFPKEVGVFPFECGMGMFHGKIIVK